ncbi:MAG: SDR family oxidoreductase [Bacteroidota bacterium]|nr:SDR family oxidoreductase [Bacteroidota bacterium]
MKKDFEGKVVVVTGASAGLGRAIVKAFAQQGAKVGLIARGTEGLDGAKKDVEDAGSQAIAVPTDVSDNEAVEKAAEQIEQQLGPIDIWINNAMVSVFGPLQEMKADEFKRVTEVTYLGQVYGTMAALKRMLPRNSGKIILIGSALAYRGIPLQSAYCGAKHGIHGFFESLRAELIHDKSAIQLSMVQMPAMNTTQFGFVKSYLPNKPQPMGTIYEPEAATNAVLYAAKNDVREVFYGYSTYETVLGNKFLPSFLDKYLAKTGYKGQQTNEPQPKDKKNNLWEPIPGDHGARGPFNKEAMTFSPMFFPKRRPLLTLAGVGLLALGVGAVISGVRNK